MSDATYRIGQPVRFDVELRLPEAQADAKSVELTSSTLPPDDSWILIDEGTLATRRGDDGSLIVTLSFELASLEPGERNLPPLRLAVDGVETEVAWPADGAPLVRVLADLAEGEDAPRPAVGLRDPVFGEPVSGTMLVALPLGALVLALAAWWLLRRRKRVVHGVQPLATPSERLERLAPAADGVGARAVYYELSSALRAAFDEALGAREGSHDHGPGGLTDEEWLAALSRDPRVDPEQAAGLAVLLAEIARVKYGGPAPTRFAQEDALRRARALASAATAVAPAPSIPTTTGEVAA